jgi:signal peptidase I
MTQLADPPAPPDTTPPSPSEGDGGGGGGGGGRKLVRDLLEVLALAVALYIVITICLQTVRVDGPSMIPTLQNNDLLFADKLTYHLHAPERGDIVVLKQPGDVNRDIIKRIIGVPGDTIEIDGDYHLVNGQARPAVLIKPAGAKDFAVLPEPYLPNQTTDPWTDVDMCCDSNGKATKAPQALLIPRDEYFVMGDNRNVSLDSRYIGLIPRNNIIARARLRIWPLSTFGLLSRGPALPTALILPLPWGFFRRRRRIAAMVAAARRT